MAELGPVEVHQASGDWMQEVRKKYQGQVVRGEWLIVNDKESS